MNCVRRNFFDSNWVWHHFLIDPRSKGNLKDFNLTSFSLKMILDFFWGYVRHKV